MLIKIISLCLVFITVFISCKKDTEAIPGDTYIPLIRKVNVTAQPYSEYVYNNANLLTEEKSKFNFMNYHYDEKYQLVSVDYYSDKDLL
ncbi:MAG: hypothetical protein EHM47_00200, partial [Ignavibacteriales bacterium]